MAPPLPLGGGTGLATAIAEVAVQAPNCPVRVQRPTRENVTVRARPPLRATCPRCANPPREWLPGFPRNRWRGSQIRARCREFPIPPCTGSERQETRRLQH